MRAYGTRQTFMNLNHKLALALQLRPSGQHLSCVLGLVSHCEAISVGLIYEYIVKPNYEELFSSGFVKEESDRIQMRGRPPAILRK